ncbi:GAF domain-containing protein [Streptomyces sp. NPDC048208]|uniref:GAF domain-containing protein n=1 Tax=Streptomyces sp. NPDC048208 TaxID=3365515 RepID=UPI00371FF568
MMSYIPQTNPVAGQLIRPATAPLPRRVNQDLEIPRQDTGLTPVAAVAPHPGHPDELAQREELIRRLGLPTSTDADFDAFARDLAERTGLLYGFVNFFLREQTFVGLHQPPADSGYPIVGRTMSRDHGYCPEVMERELALPLPDVHASPRFSSNHVVDAIGIRAYFGVPLIHKSGIKLGTVCGIDPEPRSDRDARRIRDAVIAIGRDVMHHADEKTPR